MFFVGYLKLVDGEEKIAWTKSRSAEEEMNWIERSIVAFC